MSKIILPTKKEALVIKIKSLEELSVKNLCKVNLDEIERYICIFFDADVKAFEMVIKQELSNKDLIEEIKENLKFQISVLRQL